MKEVKISEVNEIKRALQRMELSTARGRREFNDRAITWSPDANDIVYDAQHRAERYIGIAKDLRAAVVGSHDGITDKELEAAEFVMEQLESLSRMAHETAIKNY